MTTPESPSSNDQPGITLRSLAVAIFCLVISAMYVQYVEVILADGSVVAELPLPIPVLGVFVLVSLLGIGLYALTRWQLLSKPEMFCVLLAMLIATPIMTQGMWHRFIGLIAATPRTEQFDYLDALSDKLWPHGPNLLAGELRESNPAFHTKGNPPGWEDVAVEPGRTERALTFHNDRTNVMSAVVFALPVTSDSARGIVPHEPYLVSVLVRGEGFTPQTRAFCRVYEPNGDRFQELISTAEAQKISYLHPTGFIRAGAYRVSFAPGSNLTVQVAFGLSGPGKLWLRDPKLFSVSALEWAYSGRETVSASEYAALPPSVRAAVIVRPDRWLSPAGLKFILTGYIPLRAWWQTAVSWSTLIGLLLAATLAVAVFMRRLWADQQRYQFPVFQIPWKLLGEESSAAGLPPVWKNRILWYGFGAALAWAFMRGWNFYNPKVPDLNVALSLGQYLSDPGWGGMWNITFSVSAIFLSLALFMELNVLLSLVIGYLLFRGTFWAGHTAGWDTSLGYPFRYEQAIGAYLGYAVIIIALAWRYLGHIGRAIARGRWEHGAPEALSPRATTALLLGSFVGAAIWAGWIGVSVVAILLFFSFLVTVGFVAAKLRAECGTPFGYFTPYNAMLFVGLLGGMSFFGAEAMMVCLIASGFLTVSVFFYIPGLQVELLEFGRRVGVRPRHLVYTCALGVLGGLFVGGWVFLANAYALGGESIKYQWAFNQDWFFSGYRAELSQATARLLAGTAGAAPASGVAPSSWAYVFGAAGTVGLTLLRQFMPGFWFHPIGFILGSSHFADGVWGSLAVAWLIKFVSLKFGGAEFYRRRLVPLAVGIFLGALVSILVFNVYTTVLHQRGVEVTYGALP